MAGKDKDKEGEGKRPIIVKKIKKGGHGHHGGAWKVAYADFVTAMMAFFLLLWLISTSSKSKLVGIAEYFTPTEGIKDSQGIGFKGGTSAAPEGIRKSNMSNPGVIVGGTPSGQVSNNEDHDSQVESDQDDKLFKEGSTALQQAINSDPSMQEYKNQISIEQTPEGLKIDLADSDKHPMFEPQNANLTQDGKNMLTAIARVARRIPRFMSITGHTDGSPNESGKADYTNWELSADRANTARRFILKNGIDPQQPKRVTGMADKELALPRQPRDPRNRRITIIMLKGQHLLIPDAALPQDQSDDPMGAAAAVKAATTNPNDDPNNPISITVPDKK